MNPIPDDLSLAAISDGLTTQVVGRNILYYHSLASTMDIARERARAAAPDGTAVIAGEQTAGRGRLRRSWLAPDGNIAISVLLYPQLREIPFLIMLAAVAVARTIKAVAGIDAAIKWPNDILINGKKVSGILIEMDARLSDEGRMSYAIIGIGINVYLDPSLFSEIESTATSLSMETDRTLSRVDIIRQLLIELDSLYARLRHGESPYSEWRDNLVTLGRKVRVMSIDRSFDGIAESAEEDGSLLVRLEDGSVERVIAGDVTLRE